MMMTCLFLTYMQTQAFEVLENCSHFHCERKPFPTSGNLRSCKSGEPRFLQSVPNVRPLPQLKARWNDLTFMICGHAPLALNSKAGFLISGFSTCVQSEPQLHIWYSSFPCLMGYFVVCCSQWFGCNCTRGEAAKPEPAYHSLWLDHDQIAAFSVIHGLWPLARPLYEVPSGLKPNIGMLVSRWNNFNAFVGHKSELTGNQNTWNKKAIHHDESHCK